MHARQKDFSKCRLQQMQAVRRDPGKLMRLSEIAADPGRAT